MLTTVLPRVRDIRRFGSAALDLCALASGLLDGYYEACLSVWDVAAAMLIVRESGGVVERVDAAYPPGPMFIAAPARSYPALRSLIADSLLPVSASWDNPPAEMT